MSLWKFQILSTRLNKHRHRLICSQTGSPQAISPPLMCSGTWDKVQSKLVKRSRLWIHLLRRRRAKVSLSTTHRTHLPARKWSNLRAISSPLRDPLLRLNWDKTCPRRRRKRKRSPLRLNVESAAPRLIKWNQIPTSNNHTSLVDPRIPILETTITIKTNNKTVPLITQAMEEDLFWALKMPLKSSRERVASKLTHVSLESMLVKPTSSSKTWETYVLLLLPIQTLNKLSSHRWSGARMYPMAYSGAPLTIVKVDKRVLDLSLTIMEKATRILTQLNRSRMISSTTQTSIHMVDLLAGPLVCRGTLPLKRWQVMLTPLRPVPTVCLKTRINQLPQKPTLSTHLPLYLHPQVTSIPKALATSSKPLWHHSHSMLK
jgi:hypothetical protein